MHGESSVEQLTNETQTELMKAKVEVFGAMHNAVQPQVMAGVTGGMLSNSNEKERESVLPLFLAWFGDVDRNYLPILRNAYGHSFAGGVARVVRTGHGNRIDTAIARS